MNQPSGKVSGDNSLDLIPTEVKIINRYNCHVEVSIDNTEEEKTLREIIESNERGFPIKRYYYLGE